MGSKSETESRLVRACAKYIRMSPRKVRVVANAIRSKRVADAQTALRFIQRRAVRPVLKVLNAAVAQAEAAKMDVDNLYVREIYVGSGPTLKRWLPRARGMATPILKRTSHITVVLAEEG
jgi:large subunit ribosomal protein L22